MANLKSISELAFRQLFPNPSDETRLKKEEFFATAKTEYAAAMWIQAKEEGRENGEYPVPSYLLSESEELDVVGNAIDTTSLKVLKGLPNEMWLQNVGGIGCDCQYIKSNINLSQLLCDDDSLPDGSKTYYVLGRKIKFPKGTHKTKLAIIYANNGEGIDGSVDVDDNVASIVRRRLLEIYAGKVGEEDKTNNTNGGR